MTHSYTISLHALDSQTVLPRLALLFSRRRLKIDRLEMTDSWNPGVVRFNITLRCRAEMADNLLKQLRRIVEITEIAIRETTVRQQARESLPLAATAAL